MMGAIHTESEATTTPSTAVVEAVADAEGWEPAAAPEPLYATVDPDALDAFVESSDDGRVTFTYLGYEVTVDAAGRVTLRN